MKPTIGRILHYRLSESDLGRIVHQGGYVNSHQAGQTVPLVVARVWPDEYGDGVPGVNGQAVLDGPGAFLWVTSARWKSLRRKDRMGA